MIYLGYGEPSVRMDAKDTEHFNDIDLMLFDKAIAFDHFRQKIVLIVNIFRLKSRKRLIKKPCLS
jgi:anthranilate synthase component 1